MSGHPRSPLRELDYEIDVPCVVQWGFIWFTALSRLKVKLDCQDARVVKYHEVTNVTIEAAIDAPYGRHVTPRTRDVPLTQLTTAWMSPCPS